MQYKIIENKEDINDSVIEKIGHAIHFSMNDVKYAQEQNAKQLKELKATLEVEMAKIHNIQEHHPFVKDMSDQDLHTASMYHTASVKSKQIIDKISEFEKNEKELTEELEEIYKQIPDLKNE